MTKRILMMALSVIFFFNLPIQSYAQSEGAVLIKKIMMTGFVLKGNKSLQKIIRTNQHKKLGLEEIESMMDQIKTLYLQEGYTGLINISYKIEKNKLVIQVDLLDL